MSHYARLCTSALERLGKLELSFKRTISDAMTKIINNDRWTRIKSPSRKRPRAMMKQTPVKSHKLVAVPLSAQALIDKLQCTLSIETKLESIFSVSY